MKPFYNFTLGANTYASKFLPYYQSLGVTPSQIVQYVSSLSFEFPITAGTSLSLKMDDSSVFTAVVQQWSGPIDPLGIIHDPELVSHRKKSTVVEFNYCTSRAIDYADDDSVQAALDRALEGMNHLIASYCITYPDDDVSRLTKESLDPYVPVRLIDLPDWKEIRMYTWIDNLAPQAKRPLTPEEIMGLLANANSLRDMANPFLSFQEHFSLSRRYTIFGQYDLAVLSASTGIEGLTRTVSRLASLEQPALLTFRKKACTLEEIPFHHILASLMPKLLGGNWDLTSQNAPPGKWHSSCYTLRNRILHGGLKVFPDQVEAAVLSSLSLRDYIYDLLDDRRDLLGFVSKYLKKKHT